MKLKEILPLIDSALILEIENNKEVFNSKATIPESWMYHAVTSIKPDNKSIHICLVESPKPKTLEELGYSFESGM